MKNLFLILFYLVSSSSYSQDDVVPNVVLKQVGYFYKVGWKPFSGAMLLESENPPLITKIRIKEGSEIISELFQKGTLVQVIKNGKEVPLPKELQSEFSSHEKYTDTIKIKHVTVLMSYIENVTTNERLKYSGIVRFDHTKLYYEAGVRVKMELFYDVDFKKIKARYSLFHTELGNIEFDDETQEYDGAYQLWNEDGTVAERGRYDFGKKVVH